MESFALHLLTFHFPSLEPNAKDGGCRIEWAAYSIAWTHDGLNNHTSNAP